MHGPTYVCAVYSHEDVIRIVRRELEATLSTAVLPELQSAKLSTVSFTQEVVRQEFPNMGL